MTNTGRLALALCAVAALATAGCDRGGSAGSTGGQEAIKVERGPQGTDVELNGEQAKRNIDQAGQDLARGANEAGKALTEDAHQISQKVGPAARDLGRTLAPAARQAGQAISDGARQVGDKVGPIARQVLSDAAITARVEAKLMADSQINPFHVQVGTDHGRVTLKGTVATPEARARAAALAVGTEGVNSVTNLIEVAPGQG